MIPYADNDHAEHDFDPLAQWGAALFRKAMAVRQKANSQGNAGGSD
jgi:hypothetical protein